MIECFTLRLDLIFYILSVIILSIIILSVLYIVITTYK